MKRARPDAGSLPASVGHGRRVLAVEAEALAALAARLDTRFDAAVRLIADRGGKIIVTGVGKSGHVGRKIAATLASTGTPAFFIHAAEALHGDLGMLERHDLVLTVSNSGETAEILDLVPHVKRLGVPLVALIGRSDSTLGRAADVILDASVSEEACPLGLAPTASTTAALAMGDALAVALLEHRGFRPEDFAALHPAGTLGRRLLRVADLMHIGADVPRVPAASGMAEALVEMSAKRLGVTAVVDDDGRLVGVVTDGDLRRALGAQEPLTSRSVAAVMSRRPKTIAADALAALAVATMERHAITVLFIVDADERLSGVIHLHDLLRAGVV
ncbi:MAG: D-arabinose 5-phosphate isomerase [Polyangiaceae bacterium UTPRO1]|jgi:arabinose-5-phosphate isomerase|nr:KpsF/GutQ family sugar-phosphate isomerase [Myxococcales bacterium]OQY68593.1 MAG: D-arabinose 5-phosphate isomerase [Polyangiaceae bacterium UTPRO1]